MQKSKFQSAFDATPARWRGWLVSTQVTAAVGYRGPALLAKALADAVRGQVRDLEAGALVEDLGDAFRWRRHLAHRLLAVRVRIRLDPTAAAPEGQDFGVDAVVATLTAGRRRGGDARRRAAVAFVVLAFLDLCGNQNFTAPSC